MADSFPPGEAKNSEDFGDNHSTNRSIAWASGRQVGDPYTRFTIHRTAQLRTLREAKSLPYMASAILQPSQILKAGADCGHGSVTKKPPGKPAALRKMFTLRRHP